MSNEASSSSAPAPADASESVETISFTIKSTKDEKHNVSFPATATIQTVKEALVEKTGVPVDRQRLIYSGKVMKNEETIEFYKIKNGNTVHLVKSAASSTNPGGSTATGSSAIPTNIAAGTGNNPLAGLTGARYAGHVQLPSTEMFGPDGGMGPMPSSDEMLNLMERPEFQQQMSMLFDNPQLLEQVLGSSPMFRAMGPQAREMFRSPEFRRMLTDPQMMRQMMGLQQALRGGGAGGSNPFLNPFTAPLAQQAQQQQQSQQPPPPSTAAPNSSQGEGQTGAAPGPNPFAALFGAPGGAPGAGAANPFAAFAGLGGAPGGAPREPTDEEILAQIRALRSMGFLSPQNNPLLGAFGGAGAFNPFGGIPPTTTSPPPPADTRPPEERYQEQLRQLNDMGFTDAQRNIQALVRSGGNVQGAVEQLLGGN